jgi:hypothetical protein
MKKWIVRAVAATALFVGAHGVQAGKVGQLASATRCIKSVLPGDPVLSGIHTGRLPVNAIIRRCGGLAMSISFAGKVLRQLPLQERFIPHYKARGKGLAIPDMRLTLSLKKVREAWLTRPTERYDHAILGDAFEGGGFAVKTAGNRRLEYLLKEDSVFEDRLARLVDLDGDGENEIVIVHSYVDRGAALAVFSVVDDEIVKLAETAAIGLSHRWLNPAVAADFDGDGNVEIAWVETPHIGGILRTARLVGRGEKRQLQMLSNLPGFSNHTIGSRELLQAVTFDWDGDGLPDIILPGAARKTIKVVSMAGGKLHIIDSMPIDGEINSALVAADLDGDGKGEVLISTKDGRLFSFSAQ